jgi:transposase, IS30 family
MAANELTLLEREELRAGIERRESAERIGLALARHRTTITREIARNGGRKHYSAVKAQQRAERERSRPKQTEFERTSALCTHVAERLLAKDSPMTISKELEFGVFPEITTTVSHETIYAGVYGHGERGLPKGLAKNLHRRHRCRKHRLRKGEAKRKSPLGIYKKITERPKEAEGRGEVGHHEGDLITGAYNRSAIATIVDRASRKLWLGGLPFTHGSKATLGALVELMTRIPEELRRSLTWDQGTEMATHRGLLTLCGIQVYFAKPHSPWERPSNENANGQLRRYVGKGTDLAAFGPEDLLAIETRFNTMPRRIHGWKSADQVYAEMTR